MIRERPLFRRRLKALWRQALQSTLKIPCRSIYGISMPLLRHLHKNRPLHLVDVGAHDGDFTFGLGCYTGLLSAVLVEPLPHKAAALRQRFGRPGYHVFDCALADRKGQAELRVNAMEATSSLFGARREMPEWQGFPLGEECLVTCRQRTLDSVVAEAGLPCVDLLKIDVQGAEHLVLQGGRETLARTGMIWTECSFKPLYAGSSTFSDLYGLLESLGFQLTEFNPAMRSAAGELLQVDALFIKPLKLAD